MQQLRIGISSCLLGHNMRYDGQHKLDRLLRDTLGQYVEYVPVCPEVECGLPVPREAMRLVGDRAASPRSAPQGREERDPAAPRLVTVRTGRDLTDQMIGWTERRLAELEGEQLCGFIFKSKSPSCGVDRVKVHDEKMVPHRVGSGLFAAAFIRRFPLLPVEQDGRLNDIRLRESFIERIKSLWAMEQDIADPLLDCLVGRRKLGDCVQEIGERAHSGTRYRGLVRRMGGQLFGSARFDGEQVLASNDVFQLSHLPPPEGLQPARTALFHVGGFIPYGDRVFRFLPEANLFLPFLRRGLPVYAMEVKPTVSRRRLQRFTLQELIDTIGEMTGTASRHHGAQKMLIEGYCGLGLPMLTYLAARPEEADSRFSAAMLMAAPVDARACTLIGEMLESVPRQLLSTRLTLSGVFGRLLGGEPLRMAIDIPVNTLFYKTRTGQFLTGWKRRGYSAVERIEDLSPEQRLELAGAYWISPTTFSRHPIPPDFLRTFSRLWQEGLGDDLVLPLRYHGAPVSLRAIEQRTRIRIAGFYGGEDRLIPASTADVLMRAMPRRYTHTVHAGAGHVSYIVVPAMWDSSLPIAFKPGPIDLALELARGVSAAPASARGRPGPAGSPA